MRRRHIVRWLAGAGLAVTAASAAAQEVRPAGLFKRGPAVAPCPPCATPAYPVVPCPPVAPTPTPPAPSPVAPTPADPSATPAPAPAPLPDAVAERPALSSGPDLLAEAPARGTGSGGSLMPNLMGDLLGARSAVVRYRGRLNAQFPTTTDPQGRAGVIVDPNVPGAVTFTPFRNGDPNSPLSPAQANPPYVSNRDITYFQPTTGPGSPTFDRATAQAILQTLLSTGQLNAQQLQRLAALGPDAQAQLLRNQAAINQAVTKATGGVTIPNVTVESVTGDVDPVHRLINYEAILSTQTVIPLPGTGGVVGRVKLSEDNNPFPRDRLIFNYDVFDNVPFTTDGITVNRFQFGMEKTFLDGRASFEVRLPFAGTLNSTTVQGFETTNTELGNLRMALKYLWTQNRVVNVSSGVGVALPTASDVVVLSALDGRPLYAVENESVQVEPFVAVALTPTDRLFGQVWSSVNFDTSGSPVTWNRDVFGGSGSERFWDLPYLAVDGQLGYWLVRNDYGAVRGLAPFVELHWNYAIAQDRVFDELNDAARGQGLTVASVADHELNLTAGVTTQFWDNLFVTVGGSAPLLNRPDRTFDGQFGLRVNYYFGRTAREFTNTRLVNSY